VIRLLCLHLLRLQLRLRFPPAFGDLGDLAEAALGDLVEAALGDLEADLEALDGEALGDLGDLGDLAEAALGDLAEAALGDLGDLAEAAFEPRSTIFINSQLYLKWSLK